MVNLVIKQTASDQKTKITTTITYINPSNTITNSQLYTLASSLIALTRNSIDTVNKQVTDELLPS